MHICLRWTFDVSHGLQGRQVVYLLHVCLKILPSRFFFSSLASGVSSQMPQLSNFPVVTYGASTSVEKAYSCLEFLLPSLFYSVANMSTTCTLSLKLMLKGRKNIGREVHAIRRFTLISTAH